MDNIQILLDAEISQAKESMIYQLIGKFGDRLPNDVSDEMRKMAENERSQVNKLKGKCKNRL